MKKKFMHANEPLKKFMLRQKKFIPGIFFFFSNGLSRVQLNSQLLTSALNYAVNQLKTEGRELQWV